jgi:hypothetical protein
MKKNQNKSHFGLIKNNILIQGFLTVFSNKQDTLYFNPNHYSTVFQKNLQIIYANIRV